MEKIKSVAVESITPSMARAYIDNSPGNRAINPRWVKQLAEMMQSGEFVMNGQPLLFDENGHLMDGHHRTLAVISAGVPVNMLVARGIPREYFAKIDRGRVRTFSDIAGMAGYGNSVKVAASAGFLGAWLRGDIGSGYGFQANSKSSRSWRPDKMLELLKTHPQLPEFVNAGAEVSKAIGLSPAICTGMMYITNSGEPDFSASFWDGTRAGEMLGKNDPRIRLRETSIGWKLRRLKVTSRTRVVTICKAWNAFVTDRPIALLKANPTESIPALELVPARMQFASEMPD